MATEFELKANLERFHKSEIQFQLNTNLLLRLLGGFELSHNFALVLDLLLQLLAVITHNISSFLIKKSLAKVLSYQHTTEYENVSNIESVVSSKTCATSLF